MLLLLVAAGIVVYLQQQKPKLPDTTADISPPTVAKVYRLEQTADTTSYTMLEWEEWEPHDRPQDSLTLGRIQVRYPVLDSQFEASLQQNLEQQIQQWLVWEGEGMPLVNTVKARTQDFMQDYLEHKEEMQEFGLPALPWFLILQMDVLINTADLLVLRLYRVEFTGGAHAQPVTQYFNLSLKTGKAYQQTDLLYIDSSDYFLSSAEQAFRAAVDLSPDTNLLETQYEFADGQFVMPQEFSIGHKGFWFYYNAYDIGAYATGDIRFSMSYNALQPYLKQGIIPLVAIPQDSLSIETDSTLVKQRKDSLPSNI